MSGVTLVVIAKAPAAGRSKTRLCPPCTPDQAAELAGAALADTLAAVAATPARRRLLALDGELRARTPAGLEVLPQLGNGLGERLAHALMAAAGPALVVGMDTPQLSPADLYRAAARLVQPDVDAVLGPSPDGGYWTLGMRTPVADAFDGVPMSTPQTCAFQLRRLREMGARVALLRPHRDVDTIADARAVARAFPSTAFARTLATQGLV